LKGSFVDLGILAERPSDDKILTARFVSAKP